MTHFTRLTLRGECDECQAIHVLQLDGMEQKMAKQNVGHWIVHGHFCPGPPEELDRQKLIGVTHRVEGCEADR